MSRCVSLNQARAKASANCSGCSWKRREIFSYAGSMRSDRSVVSMVGTCFLDLSYASGIAASAFLAFHCLAPAGLFVSSHSYLNRLSKKELLHLVGVWVQVTSGPPVIASAPTPVLYLLFQPRPWSSIAPPSGSAPISDGSPAPWVLPKLWPP